MSIYTDLQGLVDSDPDRVVSECTRLLDKDPAGARVDGHDRVGGVEAPAEHAAKLHLADARLEVLERAGGLVDAVGVLGLAPELIQGRGVVEALLRLVEVVDGLLGGGLLAQQLLGLVVLGPKRRVGGVRVELF